MPARPRRDRRRFYGTIGLFALVTVVVAGREALMHRGVGPASLEHAGLAVRALQGAVLYAPDDLGLPIALAHLGSSLVVADALAEPTLHLLEASEGRLVSAFGRRGEGPGEFRAPRSVVPVPGRADAFWLYDIELQRLTFVDLVSLPGRAAELDPPTLRLHSEGLVTDPLLPPDAASLVAIGFFSEGRLAFFDAEGRQVGTAGVLPAVERDLPPHVVQHAYQGSLAMRPDGSLLAIGSRHAGRLEILPLAGEPVRFAAVPYEFEPRFEVAVGSQGPAMVSGPELRFGYIHVAVTQERIYGLFSGRLRGAYRERASLGRHVHLFDWEGRLVELLELDSDAFALAVSGDDRVLFTLRHLPTPAVMRYELARP